MYAGVKVPDMWEIVGMHILVSGHLLVALVLVPLDQGMSILGLAMELRRPASKDISDI